MDDLLPPPNENIDCLVEMFLLYDSLKYIEDYDLVNFIVDMDKNIQLPDEVDTALTFFYNKGKLDKNHRKTLDNCYVLLKNIFCIGEDGNLYKTFMLE